MLEARCSGKVLHDALLLLDAHSPSAEPSPAEVARMARSAEASLSAVLEGFVGRSIAVSILEAGRRRQPAPRTMDEFVEHWRGLLDAVEYVAGVAGMNMVNGRLEQRLRTLAGAPPGGPP